MKGKKTLHLLILYICLLVIFIKCRHKDKNLPHLKINNQEGKLLMNVYNRCLIQCFVLSLHTFQCFVFMFFLLLVSERRESK